MNRLNSTLSITLNNVKLQAAEISLKGDRLFISNIGEVYFNEEIDFSVDKETKMLSTLLLAYEEFCIKNTVSSSSASIILPQELFISASFVAELSLLHTDLIDEFKWRLAILYPFLNWNDYVISYCDAGVTANEKQFNAIVFALNRKYIKIANDFCSKTNLKLNFLDHSHLAANNLQKVNPYYDSEARISFYLNQKSLSLLVSKHNNPLKYQDIPITNFNQIPELINGKIIELKDAYSNLNDAVLFGDSSSHTIAKVLTDLTGINFKLINPFIHFQADEKILVNKYFTETNHLFSASVGAALRV
ncbi:MAG: hypothetical protein HXY50_04470 [Ignavibacteriaceae bacterium]|nr:hypothetical protein [Ignavibacteriaceae bacterium]